MADGVVYIKIAKTDKNGINQTNTLQSLNQVTIPYSTGNITYKVLNIVEHPTFFLYYVNPAGVEWADRAEIKYDFTGSLISRPSPSGEGIRNPDYINTNIETDNLNFWNTLPIPGWRDSKEHFYEILTYPQKNINIRVTGSISSGNTSTDTFNIILAAEDATNGGQVPVANQSWVPSTTATQSFDLNYTFTPPNLQPGDRVFVYITKTGTDPITRYDFHGTSSFFISSSDATGLQVGLVPEPYFGSNDFKRALDCQPLLNNVDTNRRHNLYQDVDYSAGITEPTNFDLLISGSALRAEVQLSNYTTRRHVIPRYEGSKSTSQKLNTWTKGDTGTFGKTPTIESLKTVIAYCDWIGGWPPDRMNASTAHVLYLIDADGNIGVPNTSENSLPNVQGSFQTGERFRISSRTIGSGEPDPLRTVIRGGQRIEPILYTQIRKQPGAEWTSSINLVDIQTTSGSATTDYQNNGSLLEKPDYQIRDRFSFTPGVNNSNLIQSATYPVTGNSYNFYQTPIGVINETITLNIQITNLQAKFRQFGSTLLPYDFGPAAKGVFGVILKIKTNGNESTYAVFQQELPPGSFTAQVFDNVLGQTGQLLNLDDINFSIPPGVLQENSEVSIEYVFDNELINLKVKIIGGSYAITQTPIPTQDINIGNNAIWGFYDKTNYPYVITSSDAVSESLGALYGDLNVKQTDIPDSGFEPIALPWSIKYGDEFRFEGDERFTYIVGEVYGPNEGSGSRITPTGSIEVQFNKNLPVSASISSFNLDHFLIRRYVDDASQIIFKGEKPLQSQGPFILTPEFSTKELNVNIDDVITNLKERGLITGEEGT